MCNWTETPRGLEPAIGAPGSAARLKQEGQMDKPFSPLDQLSEIFRARVAEIRAGGCGPQGKVESICKRCGDSAYTDKPVDYCPTCRPISRAASITGELMTRPQYKYIDGAVLADIVRDTLTLYGED